ncbi:oligosaccharide flippase family protein [Halobacteriovorax sp.]|uniref:oligosaccharide flippase family protein n=1 Tax=Halobacteriovorax sp. TaxID=2020862 RepID=UPI003AF26684
MIRSILKGIKWFSITEIISAVISIVVPFYLTKHIPPIEFGKLSILLTIYGLFNLIARPAFGEARVQATEEEDSTKSIDDAIFTINILRGLIFIAALLLSTGPLEKYFNVSLFDLVIIMCVTAFINAFRSPQLFKLGRDLDYKKITITESVPKIANAFTSATLAITTKDISAILYGIVAGSTLRVIFSYLYTPYKPSITTNFKPLKKFFKFSSWVMLERILIFLGNNIDKVFISIFGKLTILGQYQLGKTVSYKPTQVSTNLTVNFLFPFVSKLNRTNKGKNTEHKKQLYSLIITCSIIGLAIFNSLIPNLTFILSEKWHSSLKYSSILAISATLNFLNNTVLRGILKGQGNVSIFSKIQIFKILLTLLISITQFKTLGVEGIIWAYIISELLSFLFICNKFRESFITTIIFLIALCFYIYYNMNNDIFNNYIASLVLLAFITYPVASIYNLRGKVNE